MMTDGPLRPPGNPGFLALGLSRLVGLYQGARHGRPSPCRFTPSCSAYARDALESHGAWRGSRLALRRLIRCRPWGGQGWDPVPDVGRSREPGNPTSERSVA